MYCHTEKVYLCLDYHRSLFWTPWSVWYVFFVKQDTFVERMHKTRRYLVLAAPLIRDELLVIFLTRRLPLCLRLTRKWNLNHWGLDTITTAFPSLFGNQLIVSPSQEECQGIFFRRGKSHGFHGEKTGGGVSHRKQSRKRGDCRKLTTTKGGIIRTLWTFKRGGIR